LTSIKQLANKIRGWFPKEPTLKSSRVKAVDAPTKAFKVAWYLLIFAILAFIVAAVVIFYVPFLSESLLNRTVALVIYASIVIIIYRIFGRDYFRRHPKEHRIRLMLASGAITAITSMVLFSLIFGSPQPYLPYLWIPVILLGIVGALVGNLIWKRMHKPDGEWI
jgi:amino acid transporter